MNYSSTPEGRDPILWQLAQKRAAFKKHLATYIIVNIFFWVLWYLTKGSRDYSSEYGLVPWPAWPMFGWGIGLLFHFISAYVSTGQSAVEREYEKLKNQHK
jgi:hypothetical protein